MKPGIIRVTRRLSVQGEALVKVGDVVAPDTHLLSMSTFPGRVLRTQVARQLRVDPVATEDTVLPSPGEQVKTESIVARSSMFWSHRVARSEHEGTYAGVSPSLGVIYLREHLPTQLAEIVHFNVIDELRGDRYRFREYLRVQEGQHVEKGQLIASRKEGNSYVNLFSPVFGTVRDVVGLSGTINIVPDQVSSVVTAHVPGMITAIRDRREVDVLGHGIVLDGLVGLGREAHGRLAAFPNRAEPWRPDNPSKDDGNGLRDQVLVTGHVDEQSVRKAIELGVTGIIAGSARQAELCRLLGSELGVIATGEEDLPLVIVLTEGFGVSPMGQAAYAALAGLEGRLASLSGTTHIRAGVIRPRIMVSIEPPEGYAKLAEDGDAAARAGLVEQPTDLCPGLRVRVLRGPLRGKSGVIKQLVPAPVLIATGASVLVAEIELGEGDDMAISGNRLVTVPQANLKPEEVGRDA